MHFTKQQWAYRKSVLALSLFLLELAQLLKAAVRALSPQLIRTGMNNCNKLQRFYAKHEMTKTA